MQYINFNGNIYPEHEALLPVTNRAFRYGDGFIETMVMFNKKLPLLEYHWSRIMFTKEVLSGVIPKAMDADKIEQMCLDLASVNDAVKNARLRLQFYRKGKGVYLPDEDELGYTITIDKLENEQFEAGEGLRLGLKEDCYKPLSMVSDLKNSSALASVLTAQMMKNEGWDEILLLNHYGQVCETLHYNIFIYKDGRFITPGMDSGCVNGVMRSFLFSFMGDLIDERPIELFELSDAEEILLTNAVKGVQWVRELEGKVYGSAQATELTAQLNMKLVTPNA